MGDENTRSASKSAEKKPLSSPSSGPVKKTPGEWLKAQKGKAYWLAGILKFAGWNENEKVTEAEFNKQKSSWLKRPHGRAK